MILSMIMTTNSRKTQRHSLCLRRPFFLLLLVLVLGENSVDAAVTVEETTVVEYCDEVSDSSLSISTEVVSECASKNRQCFVYTTMATTISSTENEMTTENENSTSTVVDVVTSCGDCLDGYIEWQGSTRDVPICFNIDSLTFDDFVQEYQPIYRDSEDEDLKKERMQILLDTIAFIIAFRANHTNTNPTLLSSSSSYSSAPFELGLTKFSADTGLDSQQRAGFVPRLSEAVVEKYADYLPLPEQQVLASSNEDGKDELPSVVDWVAEGAVTSVKDQGRCGCCWTVSLAGAIEGAAYIQNGYFQSLSFQQYISCDEYNSGCNGGNLVVGMLYTRLNEFGGLTTLNSYPYSDYRGDTTEQCEVNDKPLAVNITEPKYAMDVLPVGQYIDRLLRVKSVLAEQPIAVSMKSSCRTFSSYRKGILTDDGDCACLDPYCADHAVLMVGYDDTSDPPSFKLKNSWGKSWGEDGYFRVSQQPAGPYGLFGILGHGVIPGIVTNTTAAEPDKKQKKPLSWFQILLIVVACLFGIGIIASIFAYLTKKDDSEGENDGKGDYGEDQEETAPPAEYP